MVQINKQYFQDQQVSQQELLDQLEIIYNMKYQHKYLNQLQEIYQNHQYFFLVYEFHQTSLLNYISSYDQQQSTEKYNEKFVKKIATQLIKSLNFLHKNGMIQIDLNLNRIQLDSWNNVSLQFSKKQFKKQEFMAPEVLSDNIIDRSNDVYSLGVILYFLLSGTMPTFKNDEVQFDVLDFKDISQDVKQLLTEMLQKEYSKRIGLNELLSKDWFVKEQNYDLFDNHFKSFQKKVKVYHKNQRIMQLLNNEVNLIVELEKDKQMMNEELREYDKVKRNKFLAIVSKTVSNKVKESVIEEIFEKMFDHQKNNQIDPTKYVVTFVQNLKNHFKNEWVKELFRIDADDQIVTVDFVNQFAEGLSSIMKNRVFEIGRKIMNPDQRINLAELIEQLNTVQQ